jgi:hypothetical protein
MLLFRYTQEIIDGNAEMTIYNLPPVNERGSRTTRRLYLQAFMITLNQFPPTSNLTFQRML